jgi:hypothetical protein
MHRIFENSFRLAHKIFPGGGTCLEFGVHIGNSFIWQSKQVKRRYKNSHLVGFDSWAGLPAEERGVWLPARHAEGEYSSPKDVVLRRLRRIRMAHDDRIRLVDGFFSDALTPSLRNELGEVIFVNIDVDLYRSTIELLDFVKPLLRPGTILYWDDWKDPRDDFDGDWGEHLAWNTWCEQNPDVKAETLEINPVSQRYMVVLQANGRTLESADLSIRNICRDAYIIGNHGQSRMTSSFTAIARRGIAQIRRLAGS